LERKARFFWTREARPKKCARRRALSDRKFIIWALTAPPECARRQSLSDGKFILRFPVSQSQNPRVCLEFLILWRAFEHLRGKDFS
jgi:hypothetical protein